MNCGMKIIGRIGNIEGMKSRVNCLAAVSHNQDSISRGLNSCVVSEVPSIRRRMLSTTNKMESNIVNMNNQQQSQLYERTTAYASVAKQQHVRPGCIRVQEHIPFHFCINNHSTKLQSIRYLSQSSTSTAITSTQDAKQVPLSAMNIWKEVKNPQGKIYYVNVKTHERTWVAPVGDSVKIFEYKDQVDLTQTSEKTKDAEGEVTKNLRWRISERIYNELVRSQTLYWVAFAGASGYIGYVYFSSR